MRAQRKLRKMEDTGSASSDSSGARPGEFNRLLNWSNVCGNKPQYSVEDLDRSSCDGSREEGSERDSDGDGRSVDEDVATSEEVPFAAEQRRRGCPPPHGAPTKAAKGSKASKTQQRKKRFYFRGEDDEAILLEVLSDTGLFSKDKTTLKQRWTRIHEALHDEIPVSEHSLKTRLKRLVEDFKKSERESARASGVEETVTKLSRMLGDFVQLEAEELKKKESDAKKKKKAEDENSIGGKRIRDAAVAGMESFTGQKRHKSAADAMADAIKDVSATHAELRTKEIETQMKMQADNLFVQQQMLQNSEHMQAQMASINASMQATQQETMQMMREMIAMMRRN